MSWGDKCPGGTVVWGDKCLGGQVSWGDRCPGGTGVQGDSCLRGHLSGGLMSRGTLVQGDTCQGDSCPSTKFWPSATNSCSIRQYLLQDFCETRIKVSQTSTEGKLQQGPFVDGGVHDHGAAEVTPSKE